MEANYFNMQVEIIIKLLLECKIHVILIHRKLKVQRKLMVGLKMKSEIAKKVWRV